MPNNTNDALSSAIKTVKETNKELALLNEELRAYLKIKREMRQASEEALKKWKEECNNV